jgi:hypothetical protein
MIIRESSGPPLGARPAKSRKGAKAS